MAKATKKKSKSTKKPKSELIRDYLEKHPDHTWKDAEGSLKKHGVTAGYFSMTKSKLKGSATARKAKPKKRRSQSPSRPRATRQNPSGSTSTTNRLEQAKAFAQSCGSIDQAIESLKELQKYQV